jgi:ferredoxin
MKRVLVVGTGPSGFAVLNSHQSAHDLWIMDGQSDVDDSTISTKSHLALKLKFGSMHTYVDSEALGLLDDSKYKLPISYSRGGFGEIWGNGFTPYDSSEIFPDASHNFHAEIRNAMRETLDIVSFSHFPSQLDNRFGGVDQWSNSSSFGLPTSNPTFERFLKKRLESPRDGLLYGQPSLLLDSTRCTSCGLCLTGCPYGALFDPGEHINHMAASKHLDTNKFIKGILKRLEPTSLGVQVHFTTDNVQYTELFDEVILSSGPLSTALILINSGLLPENFEIPDSQVFYGAFLSRIRLRQPAAKREVSQMVCYPSVNSPEDFQISFYAPSDLSRTRISQTVLPPFLQKLKIPKFISERIIPVIGFLPQEVSGKMLIKKNAEGFSIVREANPASSQSARKALRRVSQTLRPFGMLHLPLTTQMPAPGSGFHIGASLPLGGKYIDELGYMRSAKAVRVLDASLLPKIPAGAHTFFSMALIRALIRKAP